jgi:SAM-dependent methyltransferase
VFEMVFALETVKKSPWTLNAICPYFTMFPLQYPVNILNHEKETAVLLDPFCGRGTSLFAARMFGVDAYGIDNNPVAIAVSESKMVNVSGESILHIFEEALSYTDDFDVPQSEFWDLIFEKTVLDDLCKIRFFLLHYNNAPAKALRGIMLGALHGPKAKTIETAGYFSNQMPRTFSSKPDYSVKYWKKHNLFPDKVDIRKIITKRINRFYSGEIPCVESRVIQGDSLESIFFKDIPPADIIITSPPYYGMRTYYSDQWLRNWFLGGPDYPCNKIKSQLDSGKPEEFAATLGNVWKNCAAVSGEKTKMFVRFGSIPSRGVDPLDLFSRSIELSDNAWKLIKQTNAGDSSLGKRQADQMIARRKSKPISEYDLELVRCC